MAHHDGVRVHSAQRIQSVHQRFALVYAGTRSANGNGIRSQAFGGDFEAGARAGRSFEEQIYDHAPAQHFALVLGLPRLKGLGPVKYGFDLDAIERFDSQQSTRHGGYTFSTSST